MAHTFCIDTFESTASRFEPIKKINPTAFNMEIGMRTSEYKSHAVFRFMGEESGASLMEYVLIAAIIAVIGALIVLALSK